MMGVMMAIELLLQTYKEADRYDIPVSQSTYFVNAKKKLYYDDVYNSHTLK